MKKTPLEVLEHAMWRPHFVCSRRMFGPRSKPGEVIEMLPDEWRESLANLKSDDIANIRPDEAARWVDVTPR